MKIRGIASCRMILNIIELSLSKLLFIVVCSFLVVSTVTSCKKEKEPPVDFKYEYFPVRVGQYSIYEVDSTVYDNFSDSIYNYIYQIKEIYESEYYDNQNRLTYRIVRYYRKTASDDWQVQHVWAVNRTNLTAERVENNIRTVNLRFPVKNGLMWNANVYNSNGEQNFEISNLDIPYLLGSQTYDTTLTLVQQADTGNLISYKYKFEIYAKNVGLVYKEINDVEDQKNITPNIAVQYRIDSGVITKIKLIEHGS